METFHGLMVKKTKNLFQGAAFCFAEAGENGRVCCLHVLTTAHFPPHISSNSPTRISSIAYHQPLLFG